MTEIEFKTECCMCHQDLSHHHNQTDSICPLLETDDTCDECAYMNIELDGYPQTIFFGKIWIHGILQDICNYNYYGTSTCLKCYHDMVHHMEKLHKLKRLYKREIKSKIFKIARLGMLSRHLDFLHLNRSIGRLIWNYSLD